MCGILAIINKTNICKGKDLAKAAAIIRHRGPDDEGFLTWQAGSAPTIWAGGDTALSTKEVWRYENLPDEQNFKVGFGHRRLSILDLSPAGHQPMEYADAGLAITFNGEIYNYIEVREELIKKGHTFHTKTDTEVILHAWAQWGAKCLDKFNGMFSFVILDHKNNQLYAVRDRFGVKPMYYYHGVDQIMLASEIKQIRTLAEYVPKVNEKIVKQYLATGAVDHTTETFDTDIHHIPGGHYLYLNLNDTTVPPKIIKWYSLEPKHWSGTFDKAVDEFRELLTDSVRLRLRSDVTVGSCLSGGLDSSAVVCIAANLLKQQGNNEGQETVTACYDNAKYDEWKFAEQVIKKANAHPHRTFPKFQDLHNEVADFIWHQDEPTGSTSQFSQWAVFKKAHEAGLKVMIDGQGADEQLAGYGGNDTAFYSGLFRKAHLMSLYDEASSYKKEKGRWPVGFLSAAIQLNGGKGIQKLLPGKYNIDKPLQPDWLMADENLSLYNGHAHTLQQNLLRQIYTEPLPALLRYEDKNSMAWSIESRTPFMDYRVLEFTLGLPERYVYHRGVRKRILRSAMKGIIPEAIENRKDKMGFVTPEEVWLKGEGKEWFLDNIDVACRQFGGDLLNVVATHAHIDAMVQGKMKFSFVPWRIACFSIWYNDLMNK